jgi:hypothetical protein
MWPGFTVIKNFDDDICTHAQKHPISMSYPINAMFWLETLVLSKKMVLKSFISVLCETSLGKDYTQVIKELLKRGNKIY